MFPLKHAVIVFSSIIGVALAIGLILDAIGYRPQRPALVAIQPAYDPVNRVTDRLLGPMPIATMTVEPGMMQRALETMSNSAKAKRLYRDGLAVISSRPKDAARILGQTVELNPENAEYRNSFGAALANVGLYDQAAIEFREALRLRPGFQKASANLSLVMQGIEQRQASEIRAQLNSR